MGLHINQQRLRLKDVAFCLILQAVVIFRRKANANGLFNNMETRMEKRNSHGNKNPKIFVSFGDIGQNLGKNANKMINV